MAQREPVSGTIIRAVAASEGTDPVDLEPPLYAVVDPEALDDLFRRTDRSSRDVDGFVRFTYCGHEVTVDSSGSVTVRRRDTHHEVG